MSFNKLKSNSYCVGGRHYSSTSNIYGDTTINKKNTTIKLLRGTCTICKRSKSIIVSDKTIQAEGLGKFFTQVGKAAKMLAKNIK